MDNPKGTHRTAMPMEQESSIWYVALLCTLMLCCATSTALAATPEKTGSIESAKHQGKRLIQSAEAEAGILLMTAREEAKRLIREASIESSTISHDARALYRQAMRRAISTHRPALIETRKRLWNDLQIAKLLLNTPGPSVTEKRRQHRAAIAVAHETHTSTVQRSAAEKRRAMQEARNLYSTTVARAKAIRAQAAADASRLIAEAKREGIELVDTAQERQDTLVELANAMLQEKKQIVGYSYNPSTGQVTAKYEDTH